MVPEGIDPDLANNLHQLYDNTVYDFENKRIYSQPSIELLKKHELFIIDPITKELRIESIPEMKAVNEYIGTLFLDGIIDFFGSTKICISKMDSFSLLRVL